MLSADAHVRRHLAFPPCHRVLLLSSPPVTALFRRFRRMHERGRAQKNRSPPSRLFLLASTRLTRAAKSHSARRPESCFPITSKRKPRLFSMLAPVSARQTPLIVSDDPRRSELVLSKRPSHVDLHLRRPSLFEVGLSDPRWRACLIPAAAPIPLSSKDQRRFGPIP